MVESVLETTKLRDVTFSELEYGCNAMPTHKFNRSELAGDCVRQFHFCRCKSKLQIIFIMLRGSASLDIETLYNFLPGEASLNFNLQFSDAKSLTILASGWRRHLRHCLSTN